MNITISQSNSQESKQKALKSKQFNVGVLFVFFFLIFSQKELRRNLQIRG